METVDREGNHSLVDAAAQSRVNHFIFVSGQGEDPNSPVPFLRAKGLTSRLLRESGMGYTVLLPDLYMDVWIPVAVKIPVESVQSVMVVNEGMRRHYCVSISNVADFAVGSVGNDAAMN